MPPAKSSVANTIPTIVVAIAPPTPSQPIDETMIHALVAPTPAQMTMAIPLRT